MEYLPSYKDQLYQDQYLAHHGILGQKWGTRNGPPYPLSEKSGTYSKSEVSAIKAARNSNNAQYNKSYYTEQIKRSDPKNTIKPNKTTNANLGVVKSNSQKQSTSKNNDSAFKTEKTSILDRAKQFAIDHKKEIAIGAAVVGTALAAYGAYSIFAKEVTPSINPNKAHNQAVADYAKKHLPITIDQNQVLRTLTFDKDRINNGDVFFATFDENDVNRYRSRFNRVGKTPIYDENGLKLGDRMSFKFDVQTGLSRNLRIANEDEGSALFSKLFKSDKDFHDFVMDPSRLDAHPYAGKRHEKFAGFREANQVLHDCQTSGREPSNSELNKIYRLFNYAFPLSDDSMDKSIATDVTRQRNKFTSAATKAGFDGVLDVNDALYGGLRANAPVIITNKEALVPKAVMKTNMLDVVGSTFLDRGKELLGSYSRPVSEPHAA